MNTIEDYYQNAKNTPSDINEHLETIKKYASECESVLECGIRSCVSIWALLAAKPKKYTGIDLHHHPNIDIANILAMDSDIDFNFIKGDTIKENLPVSHLMLVDTLHDYQHLKNELNIHGKYMVKYIILHDTVSYGYQNESTKGYWLTEEERVNADSSNKGLWPAIHEFLDENPEWKMHESFTHNNGLTILKRNE